MGDYSSDNRKLYSKSAKKRLDYENSVCYEWPYADYEDYEFENENLHVEDFYYVRPPPSRPESLGGTGSIDGDPFPARRMGEGDGFQQIHGGTMPNHFRVHSGQYSQRVMPYQNPMYHNPHGYGGLHRSYESRSIWSSHRGIPPKWRNDQYEDCRQSRRYGATTETPYEGGSSDRWNQWNASQCSQTYKERSSMPQPIAATATETVWSQPSLQKPLQRPPVPPMRDSRCIVEAEAEIQPKEKGIVELNSHGWVVANCEGRHRWHADLRKEVTHWLDLSVLRFSHQDPSAWRNVIDNLAARWEYVGHSEGISSACLEKHATSILKNDRYKLHNMWKKGGCNPTMPAFVHLDPHQWSKLVHYFQSDDAKKNSEKAIAARANVTNLNYTGRTGYGCVVEKLKAQTGHTPSKSEVSAEVQIGHHTKIQEGSFGVSITKQMKRLEETMMLILQTQRQQYEDIMKALDDLKEPKGKSIQEEILRPSVVEDQSNQQTTLKKVLLTSIKEEEIPSPSIQQGTIKQNISMEDKASTHEDGQISGQGANCPKRGRTTHTIQVVASSLLPTAGKKKRQKVIQMN